MTDVIDRQLPFDSFERIATATRGAVCTSQPLASQAGLDMLKAGGNAIDAALAAAAVLAVVEPAASHLGGDVFLVFHSGAENRSWALNGSGAAPESATPDRFPDGIPMRGPLSVTVPGAVHGWCEASERWGSLPLSTVFEPAIHYARDGFPLGYRMSWQIAENRAVLAEYPYARKQFLSGDTSTGSMLRQPDLARTLETIAKHGSAAFYSGEIGREIARSVQEQGGLLSEADLEQHTSVVQEPLRVSYRGYDVLGQPPVSQGHTLLQQLNIVETFDLAAMGALSADAVHLLIEAKKLAFADRDHYLADPDHVEMPLARLLSKEYACERAGLIDMQRANPRPRAGDRSLSGSDTTYLTVVDAQGNAVSWIQSVFHRFGSGVVAGRTGVLLNNRLNGFTITPDHPNTLMPGKRPAHTLNAYIVLGNGRPWVVGGAPGGDYQVQTNLQVITGLIDFGMNIAETIDAPWWGSDDGNDLQMECRMPEKTLAGLRERGHQISLLDGWRGLRTVQLIQRLSNDAILASSDVRNEGHPAVW